MAQTHDWSRLSGLMFTARKLVDGLYSGHHRSTRHGAGLEFRDYRAYCPGDDVTKIDWKLFGRTDRYYLRRHVRPTDLQIYLLVDRTASMDFASLRPRVDPAPPTKLQWAATLAAAIAFLAIRQHDRAGLGLFSDRLDLHMAPSGTWSGLRKICFELERVRAGCGIGDVATSIRHAHATMKRGGLMVLVSDLLDEPNRTLEQLARLRHNRFDVIVFQVLGPDELDLAGAGHRRLKLVDGETRRSVRTHPLQIRERYGQLVSQHITAFHHRCTGLGIDHNLATTDRTPIQMLRRYLVHRSRAHG